MHDFGCSAEMVVFAKQRMTKTVWDFVMGGAESETTLRRNYLAWQRLAFVPEVFNDVSTIELSTRVIKRTSRLPIVLAPLGSANLVAAQSALAQSRAAREFGCCAFISGVADPGIEEVMREPHHDVVHTLYVTGDDTWVDATVERVCELGVDAVCLLADTAYFGRRERDIRNRFSSKVANVDRPTGASTNSLAAQFTWRDVERVKRRLPVPLAIKGIVTASGAVQALDHGADILYVSNHGGRQLDNLPGTGDVLREIVVATNGRAKIIVDGGICRGSDIIKALALGAHAVGIGRLQALALACGGVPALVRLLEILEHEMVVTLGLLGLNDLTELSLEQLSPVEPFASAEQLSLPSILRATRFAD